MMKHKGLFHLFVAIGFTLFAAVGFSAQNEAAPAAFFPQTLYEFSPVLDGAQVEHEFIIQNKGAALLNIERVKTG